MGYFFKKASLDDIELLVRTRTEILRTVNELENAVVPLIPMGKLIRPEDIAEAILFLSSGQAGMITGQVIKVSGGHAL